MNNATKVGIFSVITVVIFILGFYFLKGENLFIAKNKYYAVYDKVDGLYKSNQVVVNGYKIGLVSDMKYNPSNGKITVEFTVDDDIPLPADSRAVILSTDFLGGKVLDIELGKSPKILDNLDTVQSAYQSDLLGGISEKLNPVMAKVGGVLGEMEITLREINSMFKSGEDASIRDAVANLNKSLAHIEKITKEFEVLAANGSIQNSLKNIEGITGNLQKSNTDISRLLKNVAEISDSVAAADLKGTILNARNAIAELQGIVGDINNGKGTVGKLIKDDKLYADLDSTVKSLDVLLKDVKANPYRYVNVSLFGGKKRDDAYLKKQEKKAAKAKK
ncbi:MAG: MCE family protein [Chitinophagales bacterium]|nr:MCE family protein [Chitinophagales bacterium]